MKPPTEEQLKRVKAVANANLRPDGREYINSVYFDPTDRDALRAVLVHREALVAEVARLTEERDRLRSALINLTNQIVGALGIGRAGIVQEVGATNVACIEAGIRDAEDALAALHPEQPEDACPTPATGKGLNAPPIDDFRTYAPPTDTGKE